MQAQLHRFFDFSFFKDAVKATGFGENATVPYGGNKTFSCPVDGNPKPNITWYMDSEVSERPIFSGENWTAGVTGCYTCIASNYLGTSVSITQCLTVGKPFFEILFSWNQCHISIFARPLCFVLFCFAVFLFVCLFCFFFTIKTKRNLSFTVLWELTSWKSVDLGSMSFQWYKTYTQHEFHLNMNAK